MNYPLYEGTTNATADLRVGTVASSTQPTSSLTPVTSVPGQGITSNETLNYHYLTTSNTPAEQLINTHQLVWIYRKDFKIKKAIKTHSLLNIAMLNYHLQTDARRGADADYQTVQDVTDMWSLQGVVVNSQSGTTYPGNNNSGDSYRGTFSKQSKIVNLTVSGWSTTLNLWGKIADGDTLFFTIAKTKLDAGTKFCFNTGASKILESDVECYQIFPSKAPWFMDKRFDAYKGTDIVSMQIGRAYRSKRMTDVQTPSLRVTRDAVFMVHHCSQFEFLVDIKQPNHTLKYLWKVKAKILKN